MQGDAAEQVAQGVLHGNGQHGGENGGAGKQVVEFDAGEIEAEEGPADVGDDDQDVAEDARNPQVHPGQRDIEEGQASETDDRQAFAEDGQLA